jgi:hypothetical protein
MRLLIHHPSDLFQVEASYYVKFQTFKLFVHIPMAPTVSLLCLLKFHPVPFTDTHSLLPDLVNTLLSLSKGSSTRLHSEVNPAYLTGCQTASSLYLCKQQGILH